MSEIAVEQHARQARFRAGTFGKAGPALTVTMRGAYYGATEQIAAGWEDNALQMVAVPAPKRDDLLTVCIRNNGKVRIALYASSDRTLSRSHVTVNGHLQHASPTFGFWEGKPHTLGQRAGLTVERIAVFRGPFAHAWIVWTAFVLFGLALPLGFGWLLLRAVRED
jgi:hypothetical protein